MAANNSLSVGSVGICHAHGQPFRGRSMSWRRVLVALLLLSFAVCFAQFQHIQKNGSVRVRVVFSDGQPCNLHARVSLWSKALPVPLSQTSTDDNCRADFSGLAAGQYYVSVSGVGIDGTESPQFEVGGTTASVDVSVRHSEAKTAAGSYSATIGVADLSIPDKARKEFAKAGALITKENWQKAEEHLNKAVTLYPAFAAAYNNLGVVYARLGDRDREREALQHAVRLNEHFAPALTNLGRMAVVDRNLPEAESLLSKATAVDPDDVQTLVLLAKVQLLNQHFEGAIASCRKVHSLNHSSLAMVHYIAARALESLHHLAEAASELRTYLNEQPSGPGAEAARKEMAVLENQTHLNGEPR